MEVALRAEIRYLRVCLRLARAEYQDAVGTIQELRERIEQLEAELEDPQDDREGGIA